MRFKLAIFLNDVAQLEYDRNIPLDIKLADHLTKMDNKMDAGFTIGETSIDQPDPAKKAEFVASNLYHAIKANNERMANAMTSYLAVYSADLKQVKLNDTTGEVAIELIYDEEYVNQVGVQFNH